MSVNATDPARWHCLRCWQTVGWLAVAALLALSLLPLPHSGLPVPQGDKWGHLLAYGLLAAWFGQWAQHRRGRLRQMLALLALGAAVELLQGLTPSRSPEWLDLAANAAGILLGAALAAGPAAGLLKALDARLARKPAAAGRNAAGATRRGVGDSCED